jgi:hypothetical protein
LASSGLLRLYALESKDSEEALASNSSCFLNVMKISYL